MLFSVNANSQDIISVKELSKQLKAGNCVVISAQKKKQFAKVHIKGAININHKDLYKAGAVEGRLKSVSELATIFGKKGISNNNKIVIYDHGKGKYSGRIYWVLKYLGCKDVKILNGHITAWKSARKAITKNPTKVKKATFKAVVNKSVLANMANVKSGKYLVVDVRSAGEYNGTEGKDVRKGHIPKAVNFDFSKMLSQGKLKPTTQLQKMFNDAGITKDKKIILYCTTSVRAGVVFMVLKTVLKYPNVKVYDGALNEWSSVSSNKVVLIPGNSG